MQHCTNVPYIPRTLYYIFYIYNRIAKIVVSIFLGAIAANFVSSIPPPMPAIMKSKAITHSI